MVVTRRLTPIPVGLVLPALDAAHHTVFARQASVGCLALAAAQLSEEHGEGMVNGVLCLKGTWNNELGNTDLPPGAAADPNVLAFSTVPEREVAKDGTEYKQVHLRAAYASVDDGAVGYWRFWESPKWAPAFDALMRGDSEAFTDELAKAGYFTGSRVDYARVLARLQPVWVARWGQ